MKYIVLFAIVLLSTSLFAQNKISGKVYYKDSNEPFAYADVTIPNTSYYISTNNDGSFYLETQETFSSFSVESFGFKTVIVPIKEGANYELKIYLEVDNSEEDSTEKLDEVVFTARKKYKNKKENPAYGILKKLWERRRTNGLNQFKNYQYEEYEKIEFDLNNIDSAFAKKKIFRNMEFVFNYIDTSSVSGKAFLPMYLNENLYKVVGRNKPTKLERKDLVASKTSGFQDNQIVTETAKNLYKNYNIYENRVNFFDKAFVSPVATDGFAFYDYQLLDTVQLLDGRKCYKIKYFPRRKSDFTFKGKMCIDAQTYSLSSIDFQSTKGINVNFVRDIYVEQDFENVSDSVFLPSRNYVMLDLTLIDKKDKSKGMYAHRTTHFKNYDFNSEQNDKYFEKKWDPYEEGAYEKSDEFWKEGRHEKLSKNETEIYQMLDSLNQNKKFKRIINLTEIIASGYYNVWNSIDIGNLYSTFGQNDVEGVRLRAGARTYFGQNDMWRLAGFLAYGFDDDKVKYGIEGRFMFDKFKRFTVGVGSKRDIEQLGVQLTTDDGIMTRTFASSSVLARGDNSTLSNVHKNNIFFSFEPWKNVMLRADATYQTISSASPTFNLDFYNRDGDLVSELTDSKVTFSIVSRPKARFTNYGIDRYEQATLTPIIVARYTHGFSGVINSDFLYDKINLLYYHPVLWGVIGKSNITLEAGKTFGKVPLSLLSPIPANQSYGIVPNTFSQMNYYEFVADTYVSAHWEHHDNGKIFSYIPLIKKLNLRAVGFVRGVWGDIDRRNVAINASNITYLAPNKEIYYEYGFGIENIGLGNFRIFRVDFNWRGNYLDNPNISKFGVKAGFQMNF